MDKIILEFLKYGVLGLFLVLFTWVIIYLYKRNKELVKEKETAIIDVIEKKNAQIDKLKTDHKEEIKIIIDRYEAEKKILIDKNEILMSNAIEREKEIAEEQAEKNEKQLTTLNNNTNVIQAIHYVLKALTKG